MKLIVSLLLLVAVIAPGYAQRYCFVCTDCVQPFERDRNMIQRCTAATTLLEEGRPFMELTTSGTTTTQITDAPTLPSITESTITASPTTGPTLPDTPELTTSIPGTDNTGTIPTTTPTTTAAPPVAPEDPLDPTLRCFQIERVIGDRRGVDRGCVRWVNTKEATCVGIVGESDTCRICNENECNAGIKIITSFGTILAALLIVLKFY